MLLFVGMYENRKNPRKQFYSIGLLRVVFSPLVFWLKVYRSNPHNERVLTIHFSPQNEYFEYSNRNYFFEQRYFDVYFSDHAIENQSTLQKSLDLIKSLKEPENERLGVHFRLSETMNFEEVIAILNCCEIEKKNYCMNENDLWVVNHRGHTNTNE